MLRPGMSCAEIDQRVNAFLEREGYAGEGKRLHRTGHGFGLSHHEGPFLAEGSSHELAENIVVSIEPGIYLEGLGGFRHSDTVRIMRDGYECLTGSLEDIDTLTITSWKPWTRLKGILIRRALGVGAHSGGQDCTRVFE